MAIATEESEVPVGKHQLGSGTLCGIFLEKKLQGAVAKSSIYGSTDIAINELSSEQCLLLGLLYGLAEGDIAMRLYSKNIVQISSAVRRWDVSAQLVSFDCHIWCSRNYFFREDFTALSFVYFLANITRDGFWLEIRRKQR